MQQLPLIWPAGSRHRLGVLPGGRGCRADRSLVARLPHAYATRELLTLPSGQRRSILMCGCSSVSGGAPRCPQMALGWP